MNRLLSPENLKRIDVATSILFFGGLAYTVLGFATPQPEIQTAQWVLGLGAALKVVSAVLNRDLGSDRNASAFGLAVGMTAAMFDGFIETIGLPPEVLRNPNISLAYLFPGLLGGLTSWMLHKSAVQELIHPQVGPVTPKE